MQIKKMIMTLSWRHEYSYNTHQKIYSYARKTMKSSTQATTSIAK